VSILGERYTHGHLFDFCRALREDPTVLRVLGDGTQRKSYLYIEDCVDAMLLLARRHVDGGTHVYNLGTAEVSTVDRSIELVSAHMGLRPEVQYTGGPRGWVGDSPLILLDCSKLRALGWRPRLSIAQAIGRTLAWFDENPWIFGGEPAR
jgi:UDP-glucose 4-epimerase